MKLAGMIVQREIMEISARIKMYLFKAYLVSLRTYFLKFPEIRDNYGDKNKLLGYLIHECLFHKETRGQMI